MKVEDIDLHVNIPWLIWATAGVFYLYEIALRVTPAVMTTELMQDFQVTSTEIGILVSYYYASYTLLQIPCGVIVDQFGTRKVITFSAILCVLGSILFAAGNVFWLPKMGQFIIGAGSACAFLSCLKLAADWFSPERFALFSGMTTMLGTLGHIVAGAPLALIVHSHGWRNSLLLMSVFGGVVTIVSWLVIHDKPKVAKKDDDEPYLLDGLKVIASQSRSWLIGICSGLMYIPISAFTGLWAIPYLMQRYDVTSDVAAYANNMVTLGFALGCPLAAFFSNYIRNRKYTLMLSAFGTMVLFFAMALLQNITLQMIFVILFFIGLFIGGQVLSFPCVQESNDRKLSATAVGFTNALCMFVGMIMTPFMGKLLDLFWDGTLSKSGVPIYGAEAYRMAILTVPICLVVTIILLIFVKDTYPHHHHEAKD